MKWLHFDLETMPQEEELLIAGRVTLDVIGELGEPITYIEIALCIVREEDSRIVWDTIGGEVNTPSFYARIELPENL